MKGILGSRVFGKFRVLIEVVLPACTLIIIAALLQTCGGGEDSSPPQTSAPAPGGGGTATINDPLFAEQWHLRNVGQAARSDRAAGTPGEDVDVVPVWNGGRKGEGIRIAVVDEDLEINHPDLQANVVPNQSHNYLDGTTNPTARDSRLGHGTAVAGVAAARDSNNLGGVGAAPRANLVGYNLTAAQGTLPSNEGNAMARNAPVVHISNNSWGAPCGRGSLAASSNPWRTGITDGLTLGRGGKGTIYTWSAGNGHTTDSANGLTLPVDNSNYDGRANFRGVISICATDALGKKANYSELGANNWVCAPSSTDNPQGLPMITTTDVTGSAGANSTDPQCRPWITESTDLNYTRCFSGTSSAAPLASGVIALVLQANPNLTWRDLRLILAETARKNDPGDPDWKEDGGSDTTGRKYHFNHKYGFGVIDAQAAVERALSWTNVAQEKTPVPSLERNFNVPIPIPDNNPTGVNDTISVNGSGISSIEWVEVTFTATHTYQGDLQVTLTHETTGTTSRLAETHWCVDYDPITDQRIGINLNACSGSYTSWMFGSARHLGEAADGNWRLNVADRNPPIQGTFNSWSIKIYGR